MQDGIQTYYNTVSDVIQVADHQFIECHVIHLWTSLMLFAWVSAMNCSRFYAYSLAGMRKFFSGDGWDFSGTLTPDNVWDGYIITTLWEERHAQ